MSGMARSMRRANARKNGTFVPQKPLREKNGRTFIEVIIDAMRMKKRLKEMKTINK